MLAVPTYTPDMERHPAVQPGQLLYSAKLDRGSLKCYYRCCQCNCCPSTQAARTFMDVYEEGVLVNIPTALCGCICARDHGTMLFWADPMFTSDATKGGCCTPFPYCCPHACNCCGETVILKSGCCGCPSYGLHWPCVACCFCPVDVFAGLKAGEAEAVAHHINEAKKKSFTGGPPIPSGAPMVAAPPNDKTML